LSVSLDNGYFPPEVLWSRMQVTLKNYPGLFGETTDGELLELP